MTTRPILARALAQAFLSGDWDWRVMLARGLAVVPDASPRLKDAVRAVLERWPRPPLHEPEAVEAFLADGLAERWRLDTIVRRPGQLPERRRPQLRRWLPFTPTMGPQRWPVRPLATLADVARWLELDDGQLAWLADRKGLNRGAPPGPLHHYQLRWVPRPGRLPRLLEAPAPRLKDAQRRILREVLDLVPAHDAAHGFVRGRSVVTHAAIHQGQRVVVRLDLDAFFTHVPTARVQGVFHAAGYPAEVATTLAALCTTRTPWHALHAMPLEAPLVSQAFFLRQRLAAWHLPQGAPTSPALANLVCWHLDARLAGLARRLGAEYSRYADDLVFSSARLAVGALLQTVAAICRDEGFRVSPEKTRVMRAHARQLVTGLVVNQGVRVARAERERLEATLHRLALAAERGEGVDPARLAELGGHVSWVRQAHAPHAVKLEALLARAARAASPVALGALEGPLVGK